ncbi:hypothetical protein BYT27DRAFT_7258741 [Phlegmacium glaucopus]|nr:hypothetical protein BYT27DRAFT_7258741 [Phlegmacium glaucopus]
MSPHPPAISTTHSEETGMPREIYCVESQAQSDMVVAPNVQVSADTTEVATTSQLDDAGGPATTSAASIPDTITGFVCVACNTHNLLRPAKEQWYAVIKGYAVGVFHDWGLVGPLVSGARNSCVQRYLTQAAATESFKAAAKAGLVQSLIPKAAEQ